MAKATVHPLSHVLTAADLLDHLGGITADRVRLKPRMGLATEADLVAVNAQKTGLCELVDGILVEKTVGLSEAMLAGSILALLRAFGMARNLGFVTGSDGMMRLSPGSVRIPDAAFISWDKTPDRCVPVAPMSDFAPDLAVEVLSKSKTKREMARKRREYFAAGVRLVWEVDPKRRTVAVFVTPENPTVLDASQTLDGGEVLPGFALPLAELFAELDRTAD